MTFCRLGSSNSSHCQVTDSFLFLAGTKGKKSDSVLYSDGQHTYDFLW